MLNHYIHRYSESIITMMMMINNYIYNNNNNNLYNKNNNINNNKNNNIIFFLEKNHQTIYVNRTFINCYTVQLLFKNYKDRL